MKPASLFTSVGFLALFFALTDGLTIPQLSHPLTARNDFGFDPESIHGGTSGGDPLAGGLKGLEHDQGKDDVGKQADGVNKGEADVNSKGSGQNGGVAVSNGVTKLDLGNGLEATFDDATDTSELDVGKTCKLAKRRRGLLFARNPPCFTTAQFPEVGKYNDAYNKVQKQSDVFIRKQIEWTTSEALHRFEAVDERNVVRFDGVPGRDALPRVDFSFSFNEVQAEKGDALKDSQPSSPDFNSPGPKSPDLNSPAPKSPLTAQSPNTALLDTLSVDQARDLFLRQLDAAKKAPGNKINNVLAAQAKWAKYLGIDVDGFIESTLKKPVEPTSPFLQRPPAEDVVNLPNPQFRMKGTAQQAFEADLKLPPIRHTDINLKGPGRNPAYAGRMLAEYRKLADLTDELNKAGDRATRQLEKTANLPDGSLAKWLEDIRQHRYNAELKHMEVPKYIKNGYVLRAEGNKIIVQSRPLTTGEKVGLGFVVVLGGGALGYEIEEGDVNLDS